MGNGSCKEPTFIHMDYLPMKIICVIMEKELVRLYRNILKLHKKKLPQHMRVLGDQYIR
jgi:hypothetical protein